MRSPAFENLSVTIPQEHYEHLKSLAAEGEEWLKIKAERNKGLSPSWIKELIDCGLPDITRITAETESGKIELAVSELQPIGDIAFTRTMPTATSMTAAILAGVGKLDNLPKSITIEFKDSAPLVKEPLIPGALNGFGVGDG